MFNKEKNKGIYLELFLCKVRPVADCTRLYNRRRIGCPKAGSAGPENGHNVPVPRTSEQTECYVFHVSISTEHHMHEL